MVNGPTGKLVKTLWDEQKQAQESLVRDLCQPLRETTPGPGGVETGTPPMYYCLSKLALEDNIEAYLYTFEKTEPVGNDPGAIFDGPYPCGSMNHPGPRCL